MEEKGKILFINIINILSFIKHFHMLRIFHLDFIIL